MKSSSLWAGYYVDGRYTFVLGLFTCTRVGPLNPWTRVNVELVLKVTNVDGIYEEDPRINKNARLLDTLSYQDVTSKEFYVMVLTSITLCQENSLPVGFNLNKEGNISKVIKGDRVGTNIEGHQNLDVAKIQ